MLDTPRFLLAACFLTAACSTRAPGVISAGHVMHASNEYGVIAKIRVDLIEPDPSDSSGEISLYTVSVAEEDGHGWTSFCAPDAEGVAKAIPLSGRWDETGKYHDDETVTFACTAGVIAKCVRWGYVPWKSIGGVSLKDAHLACVRMARADYCGDGIGHTHDGTMIDLFDTMGIQKREPSTMEFEAAWSPHGATYLRRPRFGCTEQIVEACPEKLAGRTSSDVGDLSLEEIVRRWPETIVFNESYAGHE